MSHDGYDAENPVVSVDGWVLYASSQPQHPGLWKVRIDGSDASLVVPGIIAWPDVSPDGKYVLYHSVTGTLRATIHVVRLADGTPVEFLGHGRRGRFSGDGHSILYIRDGAEDIVRQDFPSAAGTPAKVVMPGVPDLSTDTFHVTPDGTRVVVSYTTPSRSLVLADGVPGVTR